MHCSPFGIFVTFDSFLIYFTLMQFKTCQLCKTAYQPNHSTQQLTNSS